MTDYIEDTSSYEREMGSEYEHTIDYEGECENCNEVLLINGSIWEYPVGALNLDDTNIEVRE